MWGVALLYVYRAREVVTVVTGGCDTQTGTNNPLVTTVTTCHNLDSLKSINKIMVICRREGMGRKDVTAVTVVTDLTYRSYRCYRF